MSKIILLDEITANQIAAGEVVERPVSVVKELVENSIDANASRITVNLEEGGLSSITVSDNGYGMDEEDLVLAFMRHATSKIRSVNDLSSLSTLGFRGEALPSIAAVSKTTVISRTYDGVSGTKGYSEGGSPVSVSTAGCPPGTKVIVTDLFFNTPARRKTMKSPHSEGALCGDLLTRLALARPDISYELRIKGKRVFFSSGTGRLLDAIISVYGNNQGKEMIEINAQKGNMVLKGFAGKPSLSRSNRNHITVIINGRFVQSSVIARAVEDSYKTLLPNGRKPVAVLSLETNPELLDVNVHPAKLEVRLLEEDETSIFISEAIKDVLKNKTVIPSTGTIFEKKFNKIIYDTPLKQKSVFSGPGYLKETHHSGSLSDFIKEPDDHVFNSSSDVTLEKDEMQTTLEQSCQCTNIRGRFPFLQALTHLQPAYILAKGDDGLYIIDQHAAHERILYEKFLQSNNTATQYLIAPVDVELDHGEASILIEKIIWFADAGFILEHFGGNTFLLRGVPDSINPGQEQEILHDMLDYFKEKGLNSHKSDFVRKLASAAACKNAVKAGEKLTNVAMEAIIKDLSQTDNPFTCPHGRPTIIQLSYADLKNRFKR